LKSEYILFELSRSEILMYNEKRDIAGTAVQKSARESIKDIITAGDFEHCMKKCLDILRPIDAHRQVSIGIVPLLRSPSIVDKLPS
jgi:hypothetical protein